MSKIIKKMLEGTARSASLWKCKKEKIRECIDESRRAVLEDETKVEIALILKGILNYRNELAFHFRHVLKMDSRVNLDSKGF